MFTGIITPPARDLLWARSVFACPADHTDTERDEAADMLLSAGDWCDQQEAKRWRRLHRAEAGQ